MLSNFIEFELILLNKFYLVLIKHFGQRMAPERATTGTPPTQICATGTPAPSRRGEALIKQNEQLTQQLNNSNIKMQELVTQLDSLEEQLESKEEKIKELEVEKGQLKQDVDALMMQLTGTKSDLMMEQDKTTKLLEQKHYLTRQIAAKDNFLKKAEEQIAKLQQEITHLKRHNGLNHGLDHGNQLEQLKQHNEQLQLKIAEKDDAYNFLYKAKMRNEYKIKKLATDNSVMKYTIDSLKMLNQDVVEKRKLDIEKLDTLHHALEEISTMTGDIVQGQAEDIEQEQAKRQKIEIDANNYSQRENGVVICNGCGYVCQSMKGYKSHFTRRHKDLL